MKTSSRAPKNVSDRMRYKALAQLKEEERQSIYSFVRNLERLDRGEIEARSDKQRRFCCVCHGQEAPSEIHEIAYLKYRSQILEYANKRTPKDTKTNLDIQPRQNTRHAPQDRNNRNLAPINKKSVTESKVSSSEENSKSERPSWMKKRSVENARKVKQHSEEYGDDNSERIPRPGFAPLKKYE
jgi:uncharacterized protein YifE (UPF0438 family)